MDDAQIRLRRYRTADRANQSARSFYAAIGYREENVRLTKALSAS